MHSVVPKMNVGGADEEEGRKGSGKGEFAVHRMNRY